MCFCSKWFKHEIDKALRFATANSKENKTIIFSKFNDVLETIAKK